MSSSQANASARRRRAAPANPPAPTSAAQRAGPPSQFQQPPVPQQNDIQRQQQQQGMPPRPVLTPAQMLIAHERRIAELETAMPEMTRQFQESVSALGVSPDDAEGAPWDQDIVQLNQRIDDIVQRLDEAETEDPPEDVAFFKKKFTELEKQFVSIKRMLVRVQTFAMETNLTLMKYKNGMDAELAGKIRKAHDNYDGNILSNVNSSVLDAISYDAELGEGDEDITGGVDLDHTEMSASLEDDEDVGVTFPR